MIEVRNLTKSYQTGDLVVQVLKGISFTVQDGELCAIMGPSGSGKSTLMNILGCLDTPTSGDYLFDGENVATFDESRLAQIRNEKIGFVFQSFNLLKRTTALEQVMLPLLYENVERHERHERAVAALEAVGLGERLEALPNELSGGQQQRVAIARALVNRPSLILADEPTGNLDTKTSIEIMEIFQELNRALGITILFVTHEPDIAQYTRRILLIRDGMLESDERVAAPHSASADLAARSAPIPFHPRAVTTSHGNVALAPASPHAAPTATIIPLPINRASARAPLSVPASTPAKGDQSEPESRPLALLSATPHARGHGGVPLVESFRSSLQSLSTNVTRSVLTMLGIIIGVAAVIALLAYGNGVVAKALTALERNGTNLITIQGANQSSAGVATGNQSRTLTLTDAQALADPTQCPDCGAVSPEVRGGGQITANGKNTFGAGIGVWPSFTDVHSYNPVSGVFISDSDITGNQSVVVLGANVATSLFPGTDPTGQTIRLNRQSFQVIGVMEAKGGNGFGSLDNQVYVPITTALTKLTGGRGGAPVGAGKIVDTIYVKATDASTVDKAISEVNTVLGGLHNTKNGQPDWQVTNQADQLQAAKDTQKTYQIFLFVIASISLLVGGIGIMNIMLVSVTERTREIGIRKAIGAKKRDILTQFITESVVMSLMGALTGVVLGVLAAYLVGRFYQPTIVSVQSIFIAVGFAVATGLFFGVYPAQRAAALKPIDALRYE